MLADGSQPAGPSEGAQRPREIEAEHDDILLGRSIRVGQESMFDPTGGDAMEWVLEPYREAQVDVRARAAGFRA